MDEVKKYLIEKGVNPNIIENNCFDLSLKIYTLIHQLEQEKNVPFEVAFKEILETRVKVSENSVRIHYAVETIEENEELDILPHLEQQSITYGCQDEYYTVETNYKRSLRRENLFYSGAQQYAAQFKKKIEYFDTFGVEQKELYAEKILYGQSRRSAEEMIHLDDITFPLDQYEVQIWKMRNEDIGSIQLQINTTWEDIETERKIEGGDISKLPISLNLDLLIQQMRDGHTAYEILEGIQDKFFYENLTRQEKEEYLNHLERKIGQIPQTTTRESLKMKLENLKETLVTKRR